MSDVMWAVIPFVACGLLLWLSTRIEPHWVGKDGTRMMTQGQLLDATGAEVGRPFECRVVILPDGMVAVGRRRLFRRRRQAGWWMAARSPAPPKRREVFLLRPDDPHDDGMLALKVPESSRAVAIFDDLVSRGRSRSP